VLVQGGVRPAENAEAYREVRSEGVAVPLHWARLAALVFRQSLFRERSQRLRIRYELPPPGVFLFDGLEDLGCDGVLLFL
jgi:hypothetical protein